MQTPYKWHRRLMMKFMVWGVYNANMFQGFYRLYAQANEIVETFYMLLEKSCHEQIGDVKNTTTQERRHWDMDACRIVVEPQMVRRAEQATSNKRCVICCEKHRRAKNAHPNANYKDLPPKSKTVYW